MAALTVWECFLFQKFNKIIRFLWTTYQYSSKQFYSMVLLQCITQEKDTTIETGHLEILVKKLLKVFWKEFFCLFFLNSTITTDIFKDFDCTKNILKVFYSEWYFEKTYRLEERLLQCLTMTVLLKCNI